MRNIKRLLVLLLISLTGIVSAPQLEGALLISQTNYTKEYLHKKMIEEEITELESSKFSPQNLQKYLSLIDIRGFGKDSVILRQAIVESAWFKSKLFIEGNNLFGMKLATTRPTTAIGKCRGHAKYKHWTDSVKDIILYQSYWRSKGKCSKNYYKFLESAGYATVKNYQERLKQVDLEKLS